MKGEGIIEGRVILIFMLQVAQHVIFYQSLNIRRSPCLYDYLGREVQMSKEQFTIFVIIIKQITIQGLMVDDGRTLVFFAHSECV